MKNNVAVLLPCYSEEKAIGQVIQDFKKELPQADIYVYDNNSTDNSVQIAKQSQAIVRHVPLQGKANVVRAMFHEVDADVFVMADTDGSHLASDAHAMIEALHEHQADMVVGDRMSQGSYHSVNKRRYHSVGNRFICWLINRLFRARINDVLSGYRVFNRHFVKNMPVMSAGFEVEAEMTLHALDKRFLIVEVPVDYKARPPDSAPKLNTLSDGIRIIRVIVKLFKDYKPLVFFSLLALLSVACSLAFGIPVIIEFFATGLVPRLPTAVLALGFMLIGILSLFTGLILDTLVSQHKASYELQLKGVDRRNSR